MIKKLTPDGSNDAFKTFFRLLFFIIHEKTSSGTRSSLLMGVAPEDMVGYL
jgi:hypothetical protein